MSLMTELLMLTEHQEALDMDIQWEIEDDLWCERMLERAMEDPDYHDPRTYTFDEIMRGDNAV